MKIRYANKQEIDNWNDIIIQNPDGGNVLQGQEFISMKVTAGWKARYIVSDSCAFIILEKNILFFGKIWYSPKGPGVATKRQLEDVLDELIPFAKSEGVISIKIEPELDHSESLFGLPLLKTKPVQQHWATVLVDLSPSIDDIFMGLNQKGRHAIRRAERDGVTVKKVELTDKNIQIMYSLFQETAKAAGFPLRPYTYYEQFYRTYKDHGGLFFAYVDDVPVAGAFVMVQGEKSMYKDGASIRDRVVYGASHLLQWEAIKWAKSMGSKEHDLGGTPPIDQIKDETHKFYGLGRFKTSFNKTVTEYVGAYEVPVRPFKTRLWMKYIEQIVRRLYFERHHQSYY